LSRPYLKTGERQEFGRGEWKRKGKRGKVKGNKNRGREEMEKPQEAKWQALSERVLGELGEWRKAHPKASLREIEKVLDERLAGLRSQVLTDLALASAAREETGAEFRCPKCGGKLKGQGQQSRSLQSQGGQEVELKREYGVCPKCEAGFFPPG
jgi:rubrerythrin